MNSVAEVKGIPRPELDWFKDDKPIDRAEVDKRTKEPKYKIDFENISEDAVKSNFIITHFGQSDVGVVCFFFDKMLFHCSKNIYNFSTPLLPLMMLIQQQLSSSWLCKRCPQHSLNAWMTLLMYIKNSHWSWNVL